jgi:hypothetical protein
LGTHISITSAFTALKTDGTPQTIWILPGTYTLSDTIDLSTYRNVTIRGVDPQSCRLIRNVTSGSNATLINMGFECLIQDLTLVIYTSAGATNCNLTGIVFGNVNVTVGETITVEPTGNSSQVNNCIISVINTNAPFDQIPNNYGVHFSGSYKAGNNFSFNALRGNTINVEGNGSGNNIGIFVSNGNQTSIRDTNILISAPSDAVQSIGNYVGVETNDPITGFGSIQIRTSTIGAVRPLLSLHHSYTSADIKQTTPLQFINSSYLSAPGIQIGPGVDLVTKTAGGKPFSLFSYPTTLYYGIRGNLGNNYGFLWPGTGNISNGGTYPYPDTNLTASAFYRIQQSALLVGMMASFNSVSGVGTTLVQVHRTPVGGTRQSLTSFTLNLSTTTFSGNYNFSQLFDQGDLFHVYVEGVGTNMHDLTLQFDMF